ncbi:MAG TPA: helix-turn-helix transcriptional regulator [Microbacterium sp.]|uniref:helix-turn-helix transcriptional regulator n=1 Tax=Microbacterium sp. TaxID=51671 RepID=UPI002B495292|nr:helix-turn-helix transcriptional regulator [Microbacterium sp.]HKT58378.1 helix-turn-helix transcriptional regulator [Microbacterium sp.]
MPAEGAGSPSWHDETFRTDDIATAEALVRRIYPVAKLRESRRRFWFEQTTRGAEGVTFARFKISSWIDIAVEFEQVAAYGLVLGGRYAAKTGDTDLDTSQPFLFRPGPGSSESEHLDLLMVNIDMDTLANTAARRLGVEDARVDLPRTSPVSDALRQHWMRTVAYAWQSVVQVPEVFHNDLTRAATFEAVVAAAIATFPVDVLHPGRLPDDRALTSAIRRARQYIEDHPDDPLRVEQIAESAGLSVRSLQNGFRRELEVTPLGYLRRIRLIHARDELLDADAAETTVTEVARRWGFVNLGRFAGDYQELFGEKPSRTLRR